MAVILLIMISCENEPIKITYSISSVTPLEDGIGWEGCNGLTYKVNINGDVLEEYTEYVGITRHITLEDSDYIIIEGWSDNKDAYVSITINSKSDYKKGYNYKRIDN